MPKDLDRLSEEEVAILISKLPDSKDELIMGHLRLAKYLVRRTRQRYGGDSGDLLGAATLALVKCVDRLIKGEKDGNISRWLVCCMVGAIRNEICNRSVIQIPKTTLFRRAANGEAVRLKCQEFTDLGCTSPDIDEIDRLDEVHSVLKSDLEHKVFDLRYQGLSDTEIGDVLGLSTRTIFNVRSTIGKHFLENTNA